MKKVPTRIPHSICVRGLHQTIVTRRDVRPLEFSPLPESAIGKTSSFAFWR